jgi:ABC-type multidrug transport system ATPase subunit
MASHKNLASPAPPDPSRTDPLQRPALRARGLVKRYPGVTALDGLDLDIQPGSVVAMLGPNGAGKSTAIGILATLIRPDAGTAQIAGWDVSTHPMAVRNRIGVCMQAPALDDRLTGRENLRFIGRLKKLDRDGAARAAEDLIDVLHLVSVANRPVRQLSGGTLRRFDVAASLIGHPDVLFLDEPTTGLDPLARSDVWSLVRQKVAAGTAVLLTTQYLQEAEGIADEVVLLHGGRVRQRGSVRQLRERLGPARLVITLDGGDADALVTLAATRTIHASVPGGRTDTVLLDVPDRGDAQTIMLELATLAHQHGYRIAAFEQRRATLDEVFLALPRSAEPESTPC